MTRREDEDRTISGTMWDLRSWASCASCMSINLVMRPLVSDYMGAEWEYWFGLFLRGHWSQVRGTTVTVGLGAKSRTFA